MTLMMVIQTTKYYFKNTLLNISIRIYISSLRCKINIVCCIYLLTHFLVIVVVAVAVVQQVPLETRYVFHRFATDVASETLLQERIALVGIDFNTATLF